MKNRRARFAFPFVLMLVAALAWAPPARAQLGVAAGLDFSQMSDINTSANFKNSTGYHFGAFLDLGAGPIALRPGVFYHKVGTYEVPTVEEDFDLSMIEVPVDLRWRILPTPLVKPYLLGGPVLTFPQAQDDFGDGMEDVSLTADIGGGVEVSLPGVGLTLMPELRWSIGVTKYMKDEFQVGGITFTPEDDDRRVSAVMLRLNVKF